MGVHKKSHESVPDNNRNSVVDVEHNVATCPDAYMEEKHHTGYETSDCFEDLHALDHPPMLSEVGDIELNRSSQNSAQSSGLEQLGKALWVQSSNKDTLSAPRNRFQRAKEDSERDLNMKIKNCRSLTTLKSETMSTHYQPSTKKKEKCNEGPHGEYMQGSVMMGGTEWSANDMKTLKQLRTCMAVRGVGLLDIHATERKDMIHQVAKSLQASGELTEEGTATAERAIREHDEIFPYALENAIDVIVVSSEAVTDVIPVFVRLNTPVNFGARDGSLCKYVWYIVGSLASVNVVSAYALIIAKLMSDKEMHRALWDNDDVSNRGDVIRQFDYLYDRISKKFEDAKMDNMLDMSPRVMDDAEIDDNATKTSLADSLLKMEGLERTGKLFGGIVNDFRRRFPKYKSDITDGLHSKVFAAVIFLLFACLTPTVTFGALMRKDTGGYVGVSEALLATLINGVIFSIFSCQPLIILGTTGPFLVFTNIIYLISELIDVPFLGLYVWTGLWMGLFCFLIAITDSCVYIGYFTRFSDEIFCSLIAIVFFADPWVKNFRQLVQKKGVTNETILLSLMLLGGTFALVCVLRSIKQSPYLKPIIRESIADFGAFLAIAIMTGFSYIFADVPIDKLHIPKNVTPSVPRSWFINPLSVPVLPPNAEEGYSGEMEYVSVGANVIFFSILPAALGCILVYLDTNLTGRLINSPKNALRKGHGFNWDFMIISFLLVLNSLMGLPWFYAATVRSLTHTMCLATTEDYIVESHVVRKVVKVREQRISALLIHILVGLALFATAILNKIPLFVLLGVFMFMGYAAMIDTRMWDCIKLLFMEKSKYPPTHYVRKVPERFIYIYTFTQVMLLIILWLVSESPQFNTTIMPWVAMFFPLLIALLVPYYFYMLPKTVPKHFIVSLEAED
eukprot:Nk52_evm47s1360 gene=Nk52_evmTU47s1360